MRFGCTRNRWGDTWGSETPGTPGTPPSAVPTAPAALALGLTDSMGNGRGSASPLQPGGMAAAAAAADADAGGMGGLADGSDLDPAAQNARLRSKQDASPNTCVYVGFLGSWVTEQDLADFFAQYGTLVSVRVSAMHDGHGVCTVD